MKKVLAIAFLFCNVSFFSQGGFRSRIYLPGAPNHQTKAIFETSPGQYIAAGFAWDTAGWPQAINRLTIMGLDSVGGLKWYKQYGSFGFFHYNNPFIARSYYQYNNYIYYVGCARDSVTSKDIGVFIKFDYNGDTIWQRLYRDPDPQEDVVPQMVTASADGGFLLTGFFQHWAGGGRHGLLIKTDVNGNELWRKKISKPAPNVQDGKAIIQDSATKKIVTIGYQYPFGNSLHQNIVVLDSLGNKLFNSFFGIGNPLDMIQGKDGYCYITGYRPEVDQFGTTFTTPFVAKFHVDTPTYFIWYKEYKPKSMSSGFGGIREVPGGFLLSGWLDTMAQTTGYADEHLRMVKIDLNGNKLFDKYYKYKPPGMTSGFNLISRAFEPTYDGGWVASIELFYNPKPNPFFFVKYDSTGCDSTSVYCQSVITGAPSVVNTGSTAFDIFPNPAGNRINIFTSAAFSTHNRFSITDITGKVMILSEHDPAKTVDVSGLQNGIYFVNLLENGKTVRTKKLVIQR